MGFRRHSSVVGTRVCSVQLVIWHPSGSRWEIYFPSGIYISLCFTYSLACHAKQGCYARKFPLFCTHAMSPHDRARTFLHRQLRGSGGEPYIFGQDNDVGFRRRPSSVVGTRVYSVQLVIWHPSGGSRWEIYFPLFHLQLGMLCKAGVLWA